MMEQQFIAALDQGTTSTRCILFDQNGAVCHSAQLEHKQLYPKPGWVEHDPVEIWKNTCTVIRNVIEQNGISPEAVRTLGVTNQRETTLVWRKDTGEPLYNALVWQDIRTDDIVKELLEGPDSNYITSTTGLPIATYFSGPKIAWLLQNNQNIREELSRGNVCFGTIDTWLLWKFTGRFITDVTNASRTLLMNIETLAWDDKLLEVFSITRNALPEIVPSVPEHSFGTTDSSDLPGISIPINGILGDQQAALFGQAGFLQGEAKNTYGTGCFLLTNTGTTPVHSKHGLLTTVAYQVEGKRPVYALEGSVAIAGSLVQWMRDNMGLIKSSPEIEELARTVEDSGDVYFVPAFSGLFAPYWQSSARGIITGLTGFAKAGHIARAVLEAVAFQSMDIVKAMEEEGEIRIHELKVDGGMVVNELLMQFQADLLNIPVVRPKVTETTALGAAYAAGLSAGVWKEFDELKSHWAEDKRWFPDMSKEERDNRKSSWKKAIRKSMGWKE